MAFFGAAFLAAGFFSVASALASSFLAVFLAEAFLAGFFSSFLSAAAPGSTMVTTAFSMTSSAALVRAIPFFTMWSWPFRRHSSWSFFGSSTPLFTNSSATSSSVTSML